MRLEPRPHPPAWLLAGAPVAAVFLALALAAIPLALAGADLVGAYRQMAVASLGSWFALSETLTRATPLILTGLAVAVAFRARLWNIGAEGQLYLGAVTAVAVGSGAVHAQPMVLYLWCWPQAPPRAPSSCWDRPGSSSGLGSTRW